MGTAPISSQRLRGARTWIVRVGGSIAGLGALTTSAWMLHPIAGWAALGLSFLLVDFKASAERKARSGR